MTQSNDIAPLQTPLLSAEDLEIAKVLEQSERDCDAGLSIRGDAALAYLRQVRDEAGARVSRQSR